MLVIIFNMRRWVKPLTTQFVFLFTCVSLFVAKYASTYMPVYDVNIKYEPSGCMEQITKLDATNAHATTCRTNQRIIFTQTLTGVTYAICSCDLSGSRGTSLGQFPLLPDVQYDDEDAGISKHDIETQQNNGALPIPSSVPSGTFM